MKEWARCPFIVVHAVNGASSYGSQRGVSPLPNPDRPGPIRSIDTPAPPANLLPTIHTRCPTEQMGTSCGIGAVRPLTHRHFPTAAMATDIYASMDRGVTSTTRIALRNALTLVASSGLGEPSASCSSAGTYSSSIWPLRT